MINLLNTLDDFLKIPKLYFYRWILWWLQPIYVRIFRLSAKGLENVPKEGSYLLFGNHSHKLDPFFIGAMIRRPIFQMASNEYFRIPFMRRFMWAMGAFPRQKGVPDTKAIRHTRQIIKMGYPLAVYLEGGRNWDGQTLPILKSTAGLVKLLNLPVVTVVSKGNYIAWPRWANKRRKSPITIHYSKPVIFDRKTPDEEINNRIQKAIDNNDNFTKIDKIHGTQPAGGLTRLLWRCPDCRALEGLVENKGKTLMCSACGKEWEINLHCYMKEIGTDFWKPIKEYADLMFREDEIVPLKHDFGSFLEDGEQVYLHSGEVTLYHEPRYPKLKLKKIDSGKLLLTDRALLFIKKSDNRSIRYPFANTRGRSTEKNFIFQIVFPVLKEDGSPEVMKDGRVKLDIGRFEMMNESCLKWELYYDHVRQRGGYAAIEE